MIKITIKFPLLFFLVFLLNVFSGFSQTSDIKMLEKQLNKKLPDTTKLRLLRKMTTAYSSVDPEKMYAYAIKYKTLAEKLKNDTMSVQATLDIGNSFGIRSKLDSALYYFSNGLNRAKALKYDVGIARSLANIGFVYSRLDDPEKSLKYYLQALPIYKKVGKQRGIGQCYINIGALYYDLAEYKLAENYFDQTLKAQTLAKNEKGIAAAYFALGGCSKEIGAYQKSDYYFKKSLVIREKIGDINGIALSQMGLGKLENKIGNYDKALKHLEIALKLMRQVKDPYQECVVLMAITDSYIGKNDFVKAKNIVLGAMDIAKSVDSQTGVSSCLELLTKISVSQNNIPEAFRYQTEQVAIDDTIQSQKLAKNVVLMDFNRIQLENSGLVKDNHLIAEKNTDYLKTIVGILVLLFLVVVFLIMAYRANREKQATNKILIEQKEEIAFINKELETLNIEVLDQNKELAKLNRVKNKFFSIVSHDLRSPLATLKMLFSLYREGNLNEQELKEVMERLEDATYSTSSFLDNLLEWSRSQLDGIEVKPSHFDLSDLIAENIQLIDPSVKIKGLIVKNEMNSPVEVFADTNMISVVVRNLLSNSVKFCNPGDSIAIDSQKSDSQIVLSIKDTGPGISEKDREKLFLLEHTNSFGTSGEKGYHIGLILCKDMVEQNNGKIWVESELGKGTTFYVSLPIA